MLEMYKIMCNKRSKRQSLLRRALINNFSINNNKAIKAMIDFYFKCALNVIEVMVKDSGHCLPDEITIKQYYDLDGQLMEGLPELDKVVPKHHYLLGLKDLKTLLDESIEKTKVFKEYTIEGQDQDFFASKLIAFNNTLHSKTFKDLKEDLYERLSNANSIIRLDLKHPKDMDSEEDRNKHKLLVTILHNLDLKVLALYGHKLYEKTSSHMRGSPDSVVSKDSPTNSSDSSPDGPSIAD